MRRDDGAEPSIYADFRNMLPDDVELTPLERFTFYDEARNSRCAGDDCCLVIATGEQRIYANILLTMSIGVVPPPAEQAV